MTTVAWGTTDWTVFRCEAAECPIDLAVTLDVDNRLAGEQFDQDVAPFVRMVSQSNPKELAAFLSEQRKKFIEDREKGINP